MVIGNNNIALDGVLKFDNSQEDSKKFQGCIKVENGVPKYATLFNENEFGINGKNLDVELDFNNIVDNNFNNVGQIYNSDVSSNQLLTTESLEDITNSNSGIVEYPYQYYTKDNRQNLSFKKIYFIPQKENNVITKYLVKVRDKCSSKNFNNYWDHYADKDFTNINSNNQIVFDSTYNLEGKSFTFYNNTISNGQYLYCMDEGCIILNNTEIFEGNSSENHFSKKRISFLFSLLKFKSNSKKRYCVVDNNLIIKYDNFEKSVLGVEYYVNIQITLALNDNSLGEFSDNDINLEPGTIIFSYGEIPNALGSPLVGLSNGINNENQINFDSYIDINWRDENGFGLSDLNIFLGLEYSNEDIKYFKDRIFGSTKSDIDAVFEIIFGDRINNYVGAELLNYNKKLNSTDYNNHEDYVYNKGNNNLFLRLSINDDNLNCKYFDFDNSNEYYINVFDLGELLPEKIFTAIQTNYDYDLTETQYNNTINYSSINGKTSVNDLVQLSIKTTVDNLKDSITTPVSNATPGTYNNINTTSTGDGIDLTLNITINNSNIVETITVVDEGVGYVVEDKIIVGAGELGTNSSQMIITLTVDDFKMPVILNNIEREFECSEGVGSGCSFKISIENNIINNVTKISSGTSYNNTDTLEIDLSIVDGNYNNIITYKSDKFTFLYSNVDNVANELLGKTVHSTYSLINKKIMNYQEDSVVYTCSGTGGETTEARVGLTIINNKITSVNSFNPDLDKNNILTIDNLRKRDNTLLEINKLVKTTNNLRSSITTGTSNSNSNFANKSYTNLSTITSSANGSGATLDITLEDGEVNLSKGTVTVNQIGSGYLVGDTITVEKANLDNASYDLVFTLQLSNLIELENTDIIHMFDLKYPVVTAETEGSGAKIGLTISKINDIVSISEVVSFIKGQNYKKDEELILDGILDKENNNFSIIVTETQSQTIGSEKIENQIIEPTLDMLNNQENIKFKGREIDNFRDGILTFDCEGGNGSGCKIGLKIDNSIITNIDSFSPGTGYSVNDKLNLKGIRDFTASNLEILVDLVKNTGEIRKPFLRETKTFEGILNLYDIGLVGPVKKLSLVDNNLNNLNLRNNNGTSKNGNTKENFGNFGLGSSTGSGLEFDFVINNNTLLHPIINGGNNYPKNSQVVFYSEDTNNELKAIKLQVDEVDNPINWKELLINPNTTKNIKYDLSSFYENRNLDNDKTRENIWYDITSSVINQESYNSKIYKIFLKKKKKFIYSTTLNEEGKQLNTSDEFKYNFLLKVIYTLNKSDKGENDTPFNIQPNDTTINGPFHLNPNLANNIYESNSTKRKKFTFHLTSLSANTSYIILLKDKLGDLDRRGFGITYELKKNNTILSSSSTKSINFTNINFKTDNTILENDIYKLIITSDRKIPYLGIQFKELKLQELDFLISLNRGKKFRIQKDSTNNNLKYLVLVNTNE